MLSQSEPKAVDDFTATFLPDEDKSPLPRIDQFARSFLVLVTWIVGLKTLLAAVVSRRQAFLAVRMLSSQDPGSSMNDRASLLRLGLCLTRSLCYYFSWRFDW